MYGKVADDRLGRDMTVQEASGETKGSVPSQQVCAWGTTCEDSILVSKGRHDVDKNNLKTVSMRCLKKY